MTPVVTESLSAAGAAGGGGSSMLLFGFMLLLIIGMFWFSSRTRKKQQEKLKSQQRAMEPGMEVMTSYGLYGRLVSKDEDAVKAVIEIAPGTQVTVHLQTLTNVVERDTPLPAARMPQAPPQPGTPPLTRPQPATPRIPAIREPTPPADQPAPAPRPPRPGRSCVLRHLRPPPGPPAPARPTCAALHSPRTPQGSAPRCRHRQKIARPRAPPAASRGPEEEAAPQRAGDDGPAGAASSARRHRAAPGGENCSRLARGHVRAAGRHARRAGLGRRPGPHRLGPRLALDLEGGTQMILTLS